MAIKLNKEMLLKHRFRVMLGVTILLALGGISYLEMFVDADVAKGDLEKINNKYKKPPVTANQKTLKAYQDAIDDAAKKEAEIWSKAYRDQEEYFRWPDA